MRDEVAPLLPVVAGLDPGRYRNSILQRLTNPRICDQLSRLAARGSTKMSSYLLPSLVEARTQGRPHALLTMALAAWLRYLRGYDFDGRPLSVEDPRAQNFSPSEERAVRARQLREAGASTIIESWCQLSDLLLSTAALTAVRGPARLRHQGDDGELDQ